MFSTKNQHLIEKYYKLTMRYASDIPRSVETINMACHSLKDTEDKKALIDILINDHPLATILVLKENRVNLSDEDILSYTEKLRKLCYRLASKPEEEPILEVLVENSILLYKMTVSLDMPMLFSDVISRMLQSSTLDEQLIDVILFFSQSRGGCQNILRTLLWTYELFPQEKSNKLINTIVFSHNLKYPPEETPTELLNKLALLALNQYNFEYLFYLSQFFTGLRYGSSALSEDVIMQSIFCCDSSSKIYFGMLLTEALSKFDSPNDILGMESWWAAVCKYALPSNPIWLEMLGWYEMYILSRRIYYNPSDADRYITEASPVRPTTMNVTARSVKTVQRAVETLIIAGSKQIPEYLAKIKEANIYRFHNGCTRKEYCSDSQSTIDFHKLVPLLAKIGYSQKQITEIYLNSYLRRLLRLDYFLRLLFANTTGTLNTGRSIGLTDLLGKYILPVSVCKSEDTLYLKPYGLHASYIWIDDVWKAENPVTAARLLQKDTDISVKIVLCDIYQFTCRAVPVDRLTGEILHDDINSTHSFEGLMELLQEVERQGILTTEMNHRIIKTASKTQSKEEQIALNVQYLKCCASIAQNNNSVRYFTNMITSPYYKADNYFRHNRIEHNAPVEYYDKEIFGQVLDCWNKLKRCSLSADEMFFVYINTILKHCISFSTLVYNCCNSNNGIIPMETLLSKYTDYYFCGKVVYVDTSKRAVIIKPTEFNNRPPRQQDTYIYPIPEGDQTYLRRNSECYFKLKYYNVKEYTFVLSELKLNKALRERAPEIMFLNAVLNTAYTLDLSITKIQDINASRVKLNNAETATLMEGILRSMYLRLDSSSELIKLMTVLQKNNPWHFSLDALPDISGFLQLESNEYNAQRILETLCADYIPENIARIYFNSPIKSLFTVSNLMEIYCSHVNEPDNLLVHIQKYPLQVTSEGKTNYLPTKDWEALSPGTYAISKYESGSFSYEIRTHPTIPDDYNEAQLSQILKNACQKQHTDNDTRT